jgi:hypothetical protein
MDFTGPTEEEQGEIVTDFREGGAVGEVEVPPMDAIVTLTSEVSGTFASETEAAVAMSTVGTCEGADCATILAAVGITGETCSSEATYDLNWEEPAVEDTGMDDTGMDDTGMDDTGMDDTGMDDTGMDDTGMDDMDADADGTDADVDGTDADVDGTDADVDADGAADDGAADDGAADDGAADDSTP